MRIRNRVGMILLSAAFASLIMLLFGVALIPSRAVPELARWSIRTRFLSVKSVTTAQLADWLVDPMREPPLLFDARSQEEFEVSHLPGAVREVPPEALPGDRPIVAYCSLGWRSAQWVNQMIQSGHTNVWNLEGSIFVWASEGRRLESRGQLVQKLHPYKSAWEALLPPDLRTTPTDSTEGRLVGLGPIRLLAGPAVLFVLLWWETFAPFLPHFQRGQGERVAHGARNIAFALINSGLTALIYAGVWSGMAKWAETNGFGLWNWIAPPLLWHLLLSLLSMDIATYWWHRMNHRIPFLWRFHRAHHSDTQMDVTTAGRFHFGEILFSGILRIGLIPLFGIHLWELVIYEIALLAVNQFQHANIGLPRQVDRLLRCLIVTPAMHKVHHSRMQIETDSNYSSLLSVWDRLFGSHRISADPAAIQFGLADLDERDSTTFLGIVKTPLKSNGFERASNLEGSRKR